MGELSINIHSCIHLSPDLETEDLGQNPSLQEWLPLLQKRVSLLQEQERNPLTQERVPSLQEQVHDEAGPVGADVHDEGDDEVSQICAGKNQSLQAPFPPVSEN